MFYIKLNDKTCDIYNISHIRYIRTSSNYF